MKTLCMLAALGLVVSACGEDKKPYRPPVPQTRAAPVVAGDHPPPTPENGAKSNPQGSDSTARLQD